MDDEPLLQAEPQITAGDKNAPIAESGGRGEKNGGKS